MRGSRRNSLVLVIVAGALAGAPSASAATTIGQTASSAECGFNAGVAQLSTTGPPSYSIPSDGVITSFTAFGIAGEQVKLLILERVGSSPPVFRIVEKSAFGTFGAVGLQTFPMQLSVREGREIGLYGLACAFPAPGDVLALFTSPMEPPLGTEVTFGSTAAGVRVDVSAELEPDCDSDGLGDESQDPSISSCHPRTLALDANKNKVKKSRRVTLSGQIAETGQDGSCTANQSVELQRKRPAQVGFTIVEQLTTDAAGAFSAKARVKKTFEYRAQAVETATCAGQVSNTEKVKVKKGKK